MEIIEKNILTEMENVTTFPYPEKSKPNCSPQGLSDPGLTFVVSHNNIDVKLANEMAISALRFGIAFKSKFVCRPITFHPRIQNLNSYINFQETLFTVVLLNIDGEGITPGEGTIVSIPIDNRQDFQVTAAYAAKSTTAIKEIRHAVINESDFIVLEQNDPNPFVTTTKIKFHTVDDAKVKVVIYNMGGALVRTLLDSSLTSGAHIVEWDGKDDSGNIVESGVYLYKLYAGIYSTTKKMLFVK
jgi:hypothetical protein